MAIENVTTTVTSVSTILNTVTHSTTVQAAPFLLFGLPPELVVIFTIALIAIVFGILRYQVKGMPVVVKWLRKNYSAVQFRAQEDLGGIFLYVLNARGKREETIKKTGLPIEVKIINNKSEAYFLKPKNGHSLDGKLLEQIKAKGFSVELRSTMDRKGKEVTKGYIIEKKEPTEQLAYLDVAAGGLKMYREYNIVEGTGTTMQLLDIRKKIDEQGGEKAEDSGNSSLMHEVRGAAKGFLALMAEAMQGTFKSLILPLVAGGGLFSMILIVIEMLTGHLK
jgi:hypothetical protein